MLRVSNDVKKKKKKQKKNLNMMDVFLSQTVSKTHLITKVFFQPKLAFLFLRDLSFCFRNRGGGGRTACVYIV